MVNFNLLLGELLGAAPLIRDGAPFRLVRVEGPDAGDFLQRLCSQDIVSLQPGQLRPAAFLDGKGKLVVTCLAAREPAVRGGFLLETQAAQHGPLMRLLERYHFTEQLEFRAAASVCRERVVAAERGAVAAAVVQDAVVKLRCARRGVQFERWHAADAEVLPAVDGGSLDDDLAECLRMAAGFVRVGVESEPNTLALEADLDDHCSVTKGCYTGQEVIARIHTYGHTNRALCLLWLEAGERISTPVTLLEPADQLAVGRVMHAVPLRQGAARVGVGYLPNDFQADGTELRLATGAKATVVGRPPCDQG